VAHSTSAKKRVRQNITRRLRNTRRSKDLKEAIKAFEAAVAGRDAKKAAEQLKLVYKKLDRVSAKGTIHKNAASRKKSRLAMRMNKAFAS